MKPFDEELTIGMASYAIALNPSNRITAVGTTKGGLQIFDSQTGKNIQDIQVGLGDSNLRSLKYNNGNKWFFFCHKSILIST